MRIAVLLFPGYTALDAIGPYEVLSRLPGASLTFVAHEPGEIRADSQVLGITADRATSELTDPDIVLVPGGFGTRALLGDAPTRDWLRTAHATSTWTASVCTGSLLLADAGLLDGLEATTHWALREKLGELGATPVARRVVIHDDARIAMAAGVSAGIDLALSLAARIAGEEFARTIQLAIEYDPEPPFDSGSPERAGPEIVARFKGTS